jgi:hypothetical protein
MRKNWRIVNPQNIIVNALKQGIASKGHECLSILEHDRLHQELTWL